MKISSLLEDTNVADFGIKKVNMVIMIKKGIIMTKKFTSLLVALFVSTAIYGGDIDGSAVLGSALGAAAGSAIGSSSGGREGAIIGGGVGGALGAAIGSNQDSPRSSTTGVAVYQKDQGRHYHRDKHNRRYYYSHGHRKYDNDHRHHDNGKHRRY